MTPAWKLATLISGKEKDRELPPFVGSLFSQWDARYAGDGSRVSDPLSARERDVLARISQGLSNKRIARALEISPETVKSHVKHIFLKLEVGTRTEAVFRALSLELTEDDFRDPTAKPSNNGCSRDRCRRRSNSTAITVSRLHLASRACLTARFCTSALNGVAVAEARQ
jgi:DNA-binding CsgD family transcriptional regulator